MGYFGKGRCKPFFPEHDSEGQLAVQSIDFRAQVLNVFDRSYHVGMPVFRFAPIGVDHGSCFSPDMVVPECPLTFCKSLTKRMLRPRMPRPACDGRPFGSLPFRRWASGGASFFLWRPTTVALV